MTRFIQIGRPHSATVFCCSITALGIALVGALSIGVSPALASKTQCDNVAPAYCVYQDYSYSGNFWYYTNNSVGTNHWVGLTEPPGLYISSAYNTRANEVMIGECTGGYGGQYCQLPPPSNEKDCMIPNGSRGFLYQYNWPSEPPGKTEDDTIGSIDLIYSGTSC